MQLSILRIVVTAGSNVRLLLLYAVAIGFSLVVTPSGAAIVVVACVVFYIALVTFSYCQERDRRRATAERNFELAKREAEKAEQDERMERRAQENDILDADHRRAMEAISSRLSHTPDPRAVEIRARREREWRESQDAERKARQARIAARAERAL